MANLYWTKDIRKIFDKKIEQCGGALICDRELSEEEVFRHIHEVRIFKKYADEIIEEMIEADRKDDEYMAHIKAEQAARKAEEEAKLAAEVKPDDH